MEMVSCDQVMNINERKLINSLICTRPKYQTADKSALVMRRSPCSSKSIFPRSLGIQVLMIFTPSLLRIFSNLLYSENIKFIPTSRPTSVIFPTEIEKTPIFFPPKDKKRTHHVKTRGRVTQSVSAWNFMHCGDRKAGQDTLCYLIQIPKGPGRQTACTNSIRVPSVRSALRDHATKPKPVLTSCMAFRWYPRPNFSDTSWPEVE
jgi:hypothetical protein